ncbi:hypothetical protein D3C76_894650 [compost metagenome]
MLGFAVQPRGFQVIDQLCAGQGLGQRLAQCGQQTATLAAQGLALFRTHTEQRQWTVLHRQRPPPPTAKRQSPGACARRLIVLPGPIGGGAFGFGEFQRATGFDFPAVRSVAVEQAQLYIIPAVEVLGCRADHGLAIGGGGEFARQVEQFAGLFLGVAQGLQLPALACRKVAGEGRHQQEEQQGQDVFFALDAEGEIRRNEQEIVGQERQRRTGQCRAKTASHCHQQHGGEEHQRDVRQRQYTRHRPGQGTGQHCRHHGQGVVEPYQRLHRSLAWRVLFMLGVEHVDFQPAGVAQQARRQAATEQPTAQARPGLCDQYQAGAAFDSVLDQGFRHLAGPQQHHFTAEAFGQLLGTLQAQARLLVTHAAVVHMHQAPW